MTRPLTGINPGWDGLEQPELMEIVAVQTRKPYACSELIRRRKDMIEHHNQRILDGKYFLINLNLLRCQFAEDLDGLVQTERDVMNPPAAIGCA